jgi:hypothetical protein
MANEDPQSPSRDVIFDLLSNARRRHILRRLEDAPEGVELNRLAAELAATENDVPVEELELVQEASAEVVVGTIVLEDQLGDVVDGLLDVVALAAPIAGLEPWVRVLGKPFQAPLSRVSRRFRAGTPPRRAEAG